MRFNGICLVSSNIRQLRAFYIELLQVQPSGDEDWWVDFGVVGDTQLVMQRAWHGGNGTGVDGGVR